MFTYVFDPSQRKICERFPFVGFLSENLQKRHLWVRNTQNAKQTLTFRCAHLPTWTWHETSTFGSKTYTLLTSTFRWLAIRRSDQSRHL